MEWTWRDKPITWGGRQLFLILSLSDPRSLLFRPFRSQSSSLASDPPHWLDEVVGVCDEPVGPRLEAALAAAASTAEAVLAGRASGRAGAVVPAAPPPPRPAATSQAEPEGPSIITGAGDLGGRGGGGYGSMPPSPATTSPAPARRAPRRKAASVKAPA